MKKIRVFISGQKWFGLEVLRLCQRLEFIEVVGVCSPIDDKYVTSQAHKFDIPHIASGALNSHTMPEGVDLGITAHSFDYIGKKTRYKPTIGWIGYHPSLLPRHRGRSSIEWAVRMRDAITGGTVFWLNDGIDRPKKASRLLWEHELQPMGLRLLELALVDISRGLIVKKPQRKEFSTFEPSTQVNDLYKPDLLMLERYASKGN